MENLPPRGESSVTSSVARDNPICACTDSRPSTPHASASSRTNCTPVKSKRDSHIHSEAERATYTRSKRMKGEDACNRRKPDSLCDTRTGTGNLTCIRTKRRNMGDSTLSKQRNREDSTLSNQRKTDDSSCDTRCMRTKRLRRCDGKRKEDSLCDTRCMRTKRIRREKGEAVTKGKTYDSISCETGSRHCMRKRIMRCDTKRDDVSCTQCMRSKRTRECGNAGLGEKGDSQSRSKRRSTAEEDSSTKADTPSSAEPKSAPAKRRSSSTAGERSAEKVSRRSPAKRRRSIAEPLLCEPSVQPELCAPPLGPCVACAEFNGLYPFGLDPLLHLKVEPPVVRHQREKKRKKKETDKVVHSEECIRHLFFSQVPMSSMAKALGVSDEALTQLINAW